MFHELNARQFPDVRAEFYSWPYLGMGLMAFAMFTAPGLPAMTAIGIGVCGGVVALASKQGRDLVNFSR